MSVDLPTPNSAVIVSEHKGDPPVSVGRAMAFVGLVVAVIGSAFSGTVFSTWMRINDAIYFPAVETGRIGIYPDGHFLFGWLSFGCATFFCALLIVTAWYVFLSRPRPINSLGKLALLLSGALLIGLSLPAIIQYLTLGAVPLIFGAGCLLALLISQPARTNGGKVGQNSKGMTE